MEQSKAKRVVIKTFGQDGRSNLLIFGDCMFVVDREEWEEIGKHIQKDSVVYTKYDDYKLYLWDLYHEARMIEADENVLEFISIHGDDTPLKYLQKGRRQIKNKNNLELILNKMALLIKIKKDYNNIKDIKIDDVQISKYSNTVINDSYLFNLWKLPNHPGEVEKCSTENKNYITNFQFDSRLYNEILNSKDVWYTINFKGLSFRTAVPDDVCFWDPKITIQLETEENELVQPYLGPLPISNISTDIFKNPKIHNKKSVRPYRFLGEFLPSLNKDTYQKQLEEFFLDYTWQYSGSKPQGIAARFESCYVPYEEETDECGTGCYYVLENQENGLISNLKGKDLEFFEKMCKAYKIIKNDDEEVDGFFIFDEWGTVCEKLENSDSEFGKCLNPETLKEIHKKRVEQGHKCHPDDDEENQVIILVFEHVKDRKLRQDKWKQNMPTLHFENFYPTLSK